MTTPIEKLRQALAGMTAGKWRSTHWIVKNANGGHVADCRDIADAQGITLLKNTAAEMLAVIEAAEGVSHYGNCDRDDKIEPNRCGHCDIIDALSALDEKLKQELGE